MSYQRSIETDYILWDVMSWSKLFYEATTIDDLGERLWQTVYIKRQIKRRGNLYRAARRNEMMRETMEGRFN